MAKRKGARRCTICNVNWPDLDEFETCPQCQDEDGTDYASNITPIGLKEARSLANYAEFERFYDKWDAEHDSVRLNPDFDPSIAERFTMTLQPATISRPEKA